MPLEVYHALQKDWCFQWNLDDTKCLGTDQKKKKKELLWLRRMFLSQSCEEKL